MEMSPGGRPSHPIFGPGQTQEYSPGIGTPVVDKTLESRSHLSPPYVKVSCATCPSARYRVNTVGLEEPFIGYLKGARVSLDHGSSGFCFG